LNLNELDDVLSGLE